MKVAATGALDERTKVEWGKDSSSKLIRSKLRMAVAQNLTYRLDSRRKSIGCKACREEAI
jgi:hypothetical protein